MPGRRKRKEMAVKKRQPVQNNRLQPDLAALEQHLQQKLKSYLQPRAEMIKTCHEIVQGLSQATGDAEDLRVLLVTVEAYLNRIMNDTSNQIREDVTTAIFDHFCSLISNSHCNASPAISVVLVVVDNTDSDALNSAARYLVQQCYNGPSGKGLRASLSRLYRWMFQWDGTSSLGDWVMSYVRALEENEFFDILIEVSVEHVGFMFSSLRSTTLRCSNADVVLHVLACLRETNDALDMIAPHVQRVLMFLAGECSQLSRSLLQNIVEILTAMIDCLKKPLKVDAKKEFCVKYANVIQNLECHMPSRDCRFMQLTPWHPRTVCVPSTPTYLPKRKVGLLNLGNTCYMNSIMQALLVTRQFSRHVVLNMTDAPYWSRVGVLFVKMLHSISTKLNPNDLFKLIKPPFFSSNTQHDSSEFLVYLFELLTSYEHGSEPNHDYSRPPVLTSANRGRNNQTVQNNSDYNRPGTSRTLANPRPGSSAAGPSCSLKRQGDSDLSKLPKKRIRIVGAPDPPVMLRRDSFIDNLFGGVLVTRVQCIYCRRLSVSRDVFRDLQLAFPETTGPQHKHSVQSLLDFYCSKERLTGENRYWCATCDVLRDAERSVVIESTPKHLILVLKHFKFDAKMQVQAKLCHPLCHDMRVTLPTLRTQSDHSTYTLYAAVIHSGLSLDSGHYYTLAKDNDQWYVCNDDDVYVADVSVFEKNTSNDNTPYILFYKRTDIEEPAAPAISEISPTLQEMILAYNKHYVDTVCQRHVARP